MRYRRTLWQETDHKNKFETNSQHIDIRAKLRKTVELLEQFRNHEWQFYNVHGLFEHELKLFKFYKPSYGSVAQLIVTL